MLRVTTHLQKDKVVLTPVKTLCNLRIKTVPDIDDLLKPFNISILVPKEQRPSDEYIGHLQISTPLGWTNMSNIATGIAVYVLSAYATRTGTQIQFLSGSFGENVGKLLVERTIDTDVVSIYLQDDSIAISSKLQKKVMCDGFEPTNVYWL